MTDDSTPPRMSDDAIQRGSGKTWTEWRAILDAWGAVNKPHDEIARYLAEDHGVDGWWAQGVTVGYERMIGRRAVGQRADGTFSTSASRTLRAGIAEHFAAWINDTTWGAWLTPGLLTLRTAHEHRSARFDDNDYGGIVALYFASKGEGRSSVNVQIENLPSADAILERKAAWQARLDNLATYLEQARSTD
jgi:hypothetical protein